MYAYNQLYVLKPLHVKHRQALCTADMAKKEKDRSFLINL